MDVDFGNEEQVLDQQINELRLKIQQLIQRKKMLDQKLLEFNNLEEIFDEELLDDHKNKSISMDQKLNEIYEQTLNKKSRGSKK